jgi:hypothetical protein
MLRIPAKPSMPPSAIAAAIMEDSMDARAQAVQALFTICFRGEKKIARVPLAEYPEPWQGEVCRSLAAG